MPGAEGEDKILAALPNGDIVVIDAQGSAILATKENVACVISDSEKRLISRLDEKADVSDMIKLAEKYNAAVEVINNLSERLAALESNYDPTVIK